MTTVTRTEIIVIKKSHKLWSSLDAISFLAKNLRNVALYEVRQHYFSKKKYLPYAQLAKSLTATRNVDYYALPTKVSQGILRGVDAEFKSFFGSLKSAKVSHKVSLPKYSLKNGRAVVPFNNQTVRFSRVTDTGLFEYSLCPKSLDIRFTSRFPNVKMVRVVPHSNYYSLECVYDVEVPDTNISLSDAPTMGVDLGINNFATFVTTNGHSGILNGRPLKSINQFYNKRKAKLQALLPKNQKTSKAIQALTTQRNFKLRWELHQLSHLLVNHAVSSGVGTIIIGNTSGWKQDSKLGKRNNQNFITIPFTRFIEQMTYKAQEAGINVVVTEESYTSKSSFLDRDHLPVYPTTSPVPAFSGKRLKRGLYRTGSGLLVNADANAACNIIRKVAPNTYVDGVEGVVVRPVRVTALPNGLPSTNFLVTSGNND